MALAYQPPVSDEKGPLVIRPSWRAVGWVQVLLMGVTAVGLLAAFVKLVGRTENLTLIAVVSGLMGLVIAVVVMHLAAFMISSRITVTADAIVMRHWFITRATVNPGEIARVFRCSVTFRKQPSQPAVFALSKSGRCVMSLYGDRWSPTDLDRIWRYLRLVPEGAWADLVNDRDLYKMFPNAF